MTPTRVNLSEWETATPVHGSLLADKNFDGDQPSRALAEKLAARDQLDILELARGLQVRATSFVGRITLGALEITVHPKISGAPLLNLFRYAYGLRDLHLYGEATYTAAHGSFQDLIIQQLGEEVQEILTRGLHRGYLPVRDNLASPRGHIDFTRILNNTYLSGNSLPCIHYPRSEDNLLNRVLLTGVLLGARLTSDADLRARMQRLSKMLRLSVSVADLDDFQLSEAWRSMDRRTKAYESSFKLIELLMGSAGVSLSHQSVRLSLRGFLFDMNRFFQALLSRFLSEHLQNCAVHDEHQLKGMFAFDPQQNPQRRKTPAPRPDFLIVKGSRISAVLDAKYRDLWEKPLPRDMLYQLAIYALGHNQAERRAAILYPTIAPEAAEQSITIHEAANGAAQARVDLRPVNLLLLNELLHNGPSLEARRRKVQFARQLAFGCSSTGLAIPDTPTTPTY